jgi:poly-gamma-glutamate synthesis protein (capsule biosynthesis protein)
MTTRFGSDNGMAGGESRSVHPITLFLCGDVMTGRGIDQVLPHPSVPWLYEPHVDSAVEYLAMAEIVNGPIARPVDFAYPWGIALQELDRFAPDVRIINFETSITTSEDYEPKGINYRMHPANTPCLTAARIDCCVLANNHVLDWGTAGLMDTLRALREAGVKTAGAGRNFAEAHEPAVHEVARGRVLVLGVAAQDSGVPRHWAATNTRPGVVLLPDFSAATAVSLAERVASMRRPGDLVVLSIHWSGNWGYEIPRYHRAFAHKVLDLGVIDVIHGHSSHHPKGIEVYSNRLILYGCGDFLNDYEGISGYAEFRSHLVLMYFPTLDASTGELLNMTMVPLQIKRFRLQPVETQDAAWLKDLLNREGEWSGTEVILGVGNDLVLRWRRES